MRPRRTAERSNTAGWPHRSLTALIVLWTVGLAACGGSGSKSSSNTTTAPTITTQPQSQTVTVGSAATFSVVATGTAPLSYQWSKNATVVSGATNASYTTPATVSGDNGATFTVTVSNSAGSQTSNAATLTVNPSVAADDHYAAAEPERDSQLDGDVQCAWPPVRRP